MALVASPPSRTRVGEIGLLEAEAVGLEQPFWDVVRVGSCREQDAVACSVPCQLTGAGPRDGKPARHHAPPEPR